MNLIVKIGANNNPKDVGVKGAGISRLYENKFPIPDGFILTTEAFKSFLRYNDLERKINEILTAFLTQSNGKPLRELYAEIERMFLEGELPEPLRNGLHEFYENMSIGREVKELGGLALDMIKAGRTYPLLAVRSSPTTEEVKQAGTILCAKGKFDFENAVKKVWASTFSPRMIMSYMKKADKVLPMMAVVVQKMVNADKSGVIYTCNPDTGNKEQMLVESVFGIGDPLSAGIVSPDEYVVEKNSKALVSQRIRKKPIVSSIALDTGLLVKRNSYRSEVTLAEHEIRNITEIAANIELLFQKPMEINFCVERGKMYILQVRDSVLQGISEEQGRDNFLAKGICVSSGTAKGKAKIVSNSSYGIVETGDIVIAKSIDSSIEEKLGEIAGIITEGGGRSSYQAIVSGEFNIPCIVGAEKATDILKDGIEIEINGCAVFPVETIPPVSGNGLVLGTRDAAHISCSKLQDFAFSENIIATGLKAHLSFSTFDEKLIGITDGIGMFSPKNILTEFSKNPFFISKTDPETIINTIINHLGKTAKVFYPKTVWYRLFDARTDELKQLEGGAEEPAEPNPLLGWRGIRRSLEEQSLLACEMEAVKRLNEEGINNIGIVIPFISTTDELRKIKSIFGNTKIGISIDIPSPALDIESFCAEGVDYVLINTDMLHPMVLGIDKDSGRFADRYASTKATLNLIQQVAEKCKKHKVETAVAGEFCSDPEMVSKFVEMGIDSIVSEPEEIERTRLVVARAERKILLDKLRGR